MSRRPTLLVLLIVLACAACNDDIDPSFIQPDAIMLLAAVRGDIPADGSAGTPVLATLFTLPGAPIENAEVAFSTTLGGFGGTTDQTATDLTDDQGIASVALQGTGEAGTATITATYQNLVRTTQVILTPVP